FRRGTLRAQQVADDQQRHADTGGNDQEQQGRQVFGQHSVVLSATCRQCSGRRSARLDARATSVNMVPKGGLEPPRPKPLPPQGSASTNSATWANLSPRRPLLATRQL